jgi:hypothetical protein
MTYASQSDFAAIRTNTVLDFEMTSLHPNLDSESGYGEDTVAADWQFAG